MGAVTGDTDTERLSPKADENGSDRTSSSSSAAASVIDKSPTDFCAADGARPATTTTGRRRSATLAAASVALLVLLLMLSGGFCVWTLMRLRHIEVRLERLERTDRRPASYADEQPHVTDHADLQQVPVCTLSTVDLLYVIFVQPTL